MDAKAVFNGGVMKLQTGKKISIDKWDLIIAHPPCTRLCNSGQRWLYFGNYTYRSNKIAEQQKAIVFL